MSPPPYGRTFWSITSVPCKGTRTSVTHVLRWQKLLVITFFCHRFETTHKEDSKLLTVKPLTKKLINIIRLSTVTSWVEFVTATAVTVCSQQRIYNEVGLPGSPCDQVGTERIWFEKRNMTGWVNYNCGNTTTVE